MTTQLERNFNKLVDALNHKMTIMEQNVSLMKNDVKWMRRIGYYLATGVTAIVIRGLIT